jgi:hypothetical protein
LQKKLNNKGFQQFTGYIVDSTRNFEFEDLREFKKLNSKEFQKLICNQIESSTCEVCARGAIMLSKINLGNDTTVKEFNSAGARYFSKEGYQSLSAFSVDILELIEKIYEADEYDRRKLKYQCRYPRHSNHLLANIFCNVLVNGDFNENDHTDYLIL